MVTAASVSDKAAAKLLVIRLFDAFSTLKIMWADSGYGGAPLTRWVKTAAAITLEVVKNASPHSFQVVRRRWVVERTFGWLMRCRARATHSAAYSARSKSWYSVSASGVTNGSRLL